MDRFGPKTFYALALIPAASFVATATALPTILDGGEIRESVPWIPALDIALSFRLDALSIVLALVVSGVGALVLAYCATYFSRDEPSLGRFAALLSAFAGVMYGLVTADDVIILFVFWEATSVLSYLLIGHYSGRKESRGAGLQALLVTTLGGLAMLVGIVILIVQAGTTSLSGIVAAAPPARSCRRRWCSCCSARSRSRPWCRSTSGCRPRWPLPRRSAPTCTPPRW